MTGWIIALLLAAVVGLALWRFGRLPRGVLEAMAAALCLGLAGYAWQGSPNLAGSPTPPPAEEKQPDTAFAVLRPMMMDRFGANAQLLDAADAMHRQGLEAYGIALLKGGLQKNPRSADLWVGLGNALVQHGGGLVSPAARYAFERAMALSPDHPAPPFFLGLAYAQGGELAQTEAIWTPLLARTPPTAPWRQGLAAQLALVRQARAEAGR